MIVGRLDNWHLYFSDPVWETVFAHLRVLDENTPAMEKQIKGYDDSQVET
jgi:hypothetical protein